MKVITALVTTVLIGGGSLALAEDSGSTHQVATELAGTTVTTDTSHRRSVDGSGSKHESAEAKTVVDPKGLMNKESASSRTELESKPNGDFSESKTVKHADGTLETVTNEKETAKHWTDKGKTVTHTESRVTDPKGLGNKQSSETTEKVVLEPDGSTNKTTSHKVNGTVVTEVNKNTK